MPTRHIEPGTETLQDRLDAIRALALTAAAAEAEWEYIPPDHTPGEARFQELDDAAERADSARLALMLEVEDAHRNGCFDQFVKPQPRLPKSRHG